MEFSKKNFLEQSLIKQRELSKKQREYKQILNKKLGTRAQNIVEASIQNNSQLLKFEKDELKAQLWTAKGKTYERSDKRYLREIHCHIICQEHLSDDIHRLNCEINSMRNETSRITRKIYEINLKIVPDAMHQLYVARVRKKMQILENQLEVGVRRECIFTAHNAQLRASLADLIHFRRYFDESYSKMVEKLNAEKKYINDLVEYVLNIYENSIDCSEKILNHKRDVKKKDLMYADMVSKLHHEESIYLDQDHFQKLKNAKRQMADLQPKEYRRREKMRQNAKTKLELYDKIIDKIMDYTKSTFGVEEVVKKFKEQESVYYSYFNYANEMSYHMTLLSNAVNYLYDEIKLLEVMNTHKQHSQQKQIEFLEEILEKKRESNSRLEAQKDTNKKRLDSLFEGMLEIFQTTRVDSKPLKLLLGDHTEIDIFNFRRFLKLIEHHVSEVTAAVYFMERNKSNVSLRLPVVKYVEYMCESITPLQDIVLAQQCPECAEGEAVNDVEDGTAVILEDEEFKKRLYERIKQPEMQYRLHSISQCRLPRSRILASKR